MNGLESFEFIMFHSLTFYVRHECKTTTKLILSWNSVQLNPFFPITMNARVYLPTVNSNNYSIEKAPVKKKWIAGIQSFKNIQKLNKTSLYLNCQSTFSTGTISCRSSLIRCHQRDRRTRSKFSFLIRIAKVIYTRKEQQQIIN